MKVLKFGGTSVGSALLKTAINDGAAIVNPVEVTLDRVMEILEKAY